jgi:hypothetical protein
MKIKDILGEDDTMKIKSVSGNDVTIDQGGTEVKTTADALLPDAEHPGQFQMKPPDPSKMTPGATVTPTTTSEDGGEPMTMSAQEYIDGLQQTAAENGMTLSPEDMQRAQDMMVTTPDGEVDMIASMQKAAQVFQSPEFLQMIDDMKALVANAEVPTQEVQSPFPSRNPGTPAAADAAAQANAPAKHVQSVMPSRNAPTQEGHRDTIAQGGGDVGGDATDRFINQIRDKGYERKNRNESIKSTLSEKDELYKWLTIAGIK